MIKTDDQITRMIQAAADQARSETSMEPEPELTRKVEWPIQCTVGPGLEGAIAGETKIGYVNGAKGWLIYRGYDVFELCAHSCFEEVAFLLLFGHTPSPEQLTAFRKRLLKAMLIPETTRRLLAYPVEKMSPMVALRMGVNLLRLQLGEESEANFASDDFPFVGTDEDSIPMESLGAGSAHALYEIEDHEITASKNEAVEFKTSEEIDDAIALISGLASITATVARIRRGRLPLEPLAELSHAGNFLYLATGRKPTPFEERIMDVCLILHADHGMNASTFAAMVVASTLADLFFAVGTGIAALSGPLHGGANEQALRMLEEIGGPEKVKTWLEQARAEKRKIMGVGHRVYKAYDPRARVLSALADHLVKEKPEIAPLYQTARALEHEVCASLGKEKRVFPNVDFYSGLVYRALGIEPEFFTPIFAVSRVAGWTARVLEYLENNRIFRPRAIYTGEFGKTLDRR